MFQKCVRAGVLPLSSRLMLLLSFTVLAFAQVRVSAAEPEQLPYPQMADTLITMLQRFYYDHDRIQPVLMLQRGLRAIETSEMSIDAVLQKDSITFNFDGKQATLKITEPKTLQDLTSIFAQIQNLLLKHSEYTTEDRSNMVYAMYNGALQTLDPHTILFPPKPASQFQDDLQGEFFGIGAYLSQEDGVVKIDRVMPGRPAEKAGVKGGDKIVRVDGEKTAGLSLSESVTRIKGPRGTKVALTIEREGAKDPITINVVRDLVRVDVLQAYREGDIAYVRLDEFNKNADIMLRNVLYKWDRDAEHPVMGLVLDLRFNGGGRLDKAKIISDMFLPADKEIVRTVSKNEKPYIQYSNKDNISLLDVPMLVLVSPSSASAAEILAGALQQNDRAVVIGRTSYGKGSVQQYRPLQNESIFKFTVQEYQLKDGVSIQGVGITPDVELMRHSLREDGTIDMLPFSRSSEADGEFAFASHNTYKHASTYHLGWLAEYEDTDAQRKHYISAGPQFIPDQEAQLAMDLIAAALKQPGAEAALAKANTANFGSALLPLLKTPVAERAQQEASDLAKALDAHGGVADWGTFQDLDPAQLSFSYAGPDTLQAGEKTNLKFAVKNQGSTAVGRLYAVIRHDREDPASPFWEEEVLIGNAPAQGVATGTMAYDVPPRLFAGEERLMVDLYQQGRKDPIASTSAKVTIVSEKRPQFDVTWRLQSADGQIHKDQQEKIIVTIKNDGNASSAPVTVLMSKSDDRFVQLGEGRWKLEPIAAGGQQVVEVPLTVVSSLALRTKTLSNDEKEIALDLYVEEQFADGINSQNRESLGYHFKLPLDQPIAGGSLQKPLLSLQSVKPVGDKFEIQVLVTDDNLDFVTAFLDKDKIALTTAAEIQNGLFSLSVPLHKGLNQVQILARDKDQLVRYLPVRYWSDQGLNVAADEAIDKAVAPDVLKSADTQSGGADLEKQANPNKDVQQQEEVPEDEIIP